MRNLFKSVFTVLLIAGLSLGLYSNGLNLNGMGTRAIAMGGAYVGVADDYSAVFWNPAGLTQIDKSSISVFSSFLMPMGTYTYAPAGIDIENEKKVYPAPALVYVNPISEKITIGFGAYATAGAGATWDGSALIPFNTNFPLDMTAYTWSSKVGAFTFSPMIAFKLSDAISFGATVNIVYGMLDIEREAMGQYTESLNGTGFGATLGLMFKPSDKFSFGIAFKTPQKIKLTGDAKMPGLAVFPGFPTSSGATREVTWPMWIGAGIALRPSERLTLAFDVQYTNWKKLDTIMITFDEAMWGVNLGSGSIQDNSAFELDWKDATQYRFGIEYRLSDSFALRAGYYYDPTPAPATTLNILLPQTTYNVFTFGFGYKTEKVSFDVGVEYLMGKDRDADLAGVIAGTAFPGTHGMSIWVPNIALTIRF